MRTVIAQKLVLVNSQGHILLVRKSETHPLLPGKWELPGGISRSGEDLQESLAREIHEETGLDVESSVIDALSLVYPKMYIVMIGYLAVINQADVRLNYENDQYQWVDPKEIGPFELHESHVRLVNTAMQRMDASRR